ncbi:MAG: hypothetical protein JWM23_570 [Microbacteriaceae bacterium]|nr:hypothetical protein [Microbacteriaceae bacterium]
MALDKAALLKHIRTRADHPKLIVYAVLMGLATAIERGDFDEEEVRSDG